MRVLKKYAVSGLHTRQLFIQPSVIAYNYTFTKELLLNKVFICVWEIFLQILPLQYDNWWQYKETYEFHIITAPKWKSKRKYLTAESKSFSLGGASAVSDVTGVTRKAIRLGMKELKCGKADSARLPDDEAVPPGQAEYVNQMPDDRT